MSLFCFGSKHRKRFNLESLNAKGSCLPINYSLNMSTNRPSFTKPSKKAASHISKFTYHLQHTLPEHFSVEKPQHPQHSDPIVRMKKGIRNMNFHFAEHSSDGVGSLDA